jgi:hypothetical protein
MPKCVGSALAASQGLWRHGGAGGLAVLLATLAATLATAQPVAVIVGPTESQPGNLASGWCCLPHRRSTFCR